MLQDKQREELKNLVCECYNITEPQFRVWDYLIKANIEVSIKELHIELNKDRTTIQKIINALSKKGMILKRQVHLKRGYMFVYKCLDHEKIKYSLLKSNEELYLIRSEAIRQWGEK